MRFIPKLHPSKKGVGKGLLAMRGGFGWRKEEET